MFYCQMLTAVRLKIFKPDLSRSGWMQQAPQFSMTKPCTEAGVAKENSDRVEAPARDDGAAMASSTAAGQSGANSDEPVAKEAQPEEKTGESAKDDSGVASEVESSDIESASSSTSSSTDLERLGEAPTGKLATKDRQIENPGPLCQNPKPGVLRKPGSNPSSMACGLKFTDSLVSLPDGSMFRWARCGKCFKGEVIASPSQAADVLDAMSKRRRAI